MLNHGQLRQSESVLKPETVELMSKNAMGINQMGDRRVKTGGDPPLPTTPSSSRYPQELGPPFMINDEDAPKAVPAGGLDVGGPGQHLHFDRPKKGGVYVTQILPFCRREVAAVPRLRKRRLRQVELRTPRRVARTPRNCVHAAKT